MALDDAAPTMDMPRILPLLDAGLGNRLHLVDLGDGRALALDPPSTCARSTRPLRRTS